MHDLIPFATRQLGSDTVPTVHGRDLYAYLDMTGDDNLWIKRAIKRANLVENIDFIIYYQVVENPKAGRPAVEHYLSFDAAKQVAMMSSATKGHEVRVWFIAKEKELAALKTNAVDRYPEFRAIRELLETAAETRMIADAAKAEAEAAKQEAADAKTLAAVAATKADLALADAHRLTIEEFILSNGLLAQFPLTALARYGAWLTKFCAAYGLSVVKQPVLGKPWPTENAYPLSALQVWLRAETTRPTQGFLVPQPDELS